MNSGVVEEVMASIENFYFSDGPESGEAIFNKFAEKHQHLFAEDCDILTEQKLEYTQIFNEFQELFEKHIESKLHYIVIAFRIDLIMRCGSWKILSSFGEIARRRRNPFLCSSVVVSDRILQLLRYD